MILMEKNRFLLFIFSFMPGAGQMYLDMMRKGLVLMTLFCGVVFCAAFFYFELLLALLPVIWFYAFFDAMNSGRLTYEERKQADKDFFVSMDQIWSGDLQAMMQKRHVFVGTVCLLAGIYILFANVLGGVIYRLDNYLPGFGGIFRKFPTLLISIFIIVWGVRLVKGDKKTEQPADFKEFEGEKHD